MPAPTSPTRRRLLESWPGSLCWRFGLLVLGLAASGVDGDGGGWLVGLLAIPIALVAMRRDRIRREKRIFLARAEQKGRDDGFEQGFERVVLDFDQALAPTGRGHAGNESPEAWLTWLYGQGFADEVQEAVRSGAGGSGPPASPLR